MELYKKHRPKRFTDLIGQDTNVKILSSMVKRESVPHCLLLTGPSGVGKTTVARILRKHLKCGLRDFNEMNCGDIHGIDAVREIRRRMSLRPISGVSKIWLIDEAHKLTNDAQNAFLKMLEDTPKHVYFILCTSEPNKLIRAVRTRPTTIDFKPLSTNDIKTVCKKCAVKEGLNYSTKVYDKIAEVSDGSARLALNILESILHTTKESEALAAIEGVAVEPQAIELCRLLLNTNIKWSAVSKVLKGLKEEQPETIRRMMLSYMSTVILSGGYLANRAFNIASMFERNTYDSGFASIILASYDVINGK